MQGRVEGRKGARRQGGVGAEGALDVPRVLYGDGFESGGDACGVLSVAAGGGRLAAAGEPGLVEGQDPALERVRGLTGYGEGALRVNRNGLYLYLQRGSSPTPPTGSILAESRGHVPAGLLPRG